MKKLMALSMGVVLSLSVFAQTEFGIRGGVTASSLRGDAVESLNSAVELTDGIVKTSGRTGVFAGAYVMTPLADNIGLETGVYYTQKGYDINGEFNFLLQNQFGVAGSAQLRSHYLDIPLLLNAEVAEGFYVYGGPQFSYLLNNNLRVDVDVLGISLFKKDFDVTEGLNRADFSITGGVGYKFDNFVINAGYEHGLSRLDDNGSVKSFNKAFKIGVSYRLGK